MIGRLLRHVPKRFPLIQTVIAALLLSTVLEAGLIPPPALAASNDVVYGDSLAGGWQNWSWDSNVNLDATSPVHGGSHAVAVTFTKAWGGLNLHSNGVNTNGFSSLQFYVNGGSASGQSAKVALYDANKKQLPGAAPINKYIEGGSIAAGQWRSVNIPLGDLGAANKVITGIVVQDLSGHAQPTIYLDDLSLVAGGAASGPPAATNTPVPPTPTRAAHGTTPVPTKQPTAVKASPTAVKTSPTAVPPTATPTAKASPTTVPATPTHTATPVAPPPGGSAIGGSQPFNGIPNHANEYNEAKGALQWLPQIKRAVADAATAGLIRQDERPMFENVLLGMVGVESVGKAFLVPNPSSDWYSQGLTQLTFANTYREEDPFDPMTNLHNALRAVIRYYRQWGNRWDRAVAQHLSGAEDENAQRYQRDWNGTDGQDYAERVINVVWQAHQLEASGDLYPNHDNANQANCNICSYTHAATWNLWDSPNLAYNWAPPTNNTAYWYMKAGVDGNISQPIAKNTWISTPSWFYTTSPAPNVAPMNPRQPTAAEANAYPAGHTTNVPHGETYPYRTWSVSNP